MPNFWAMLQCEMKSQVCNISDSHVWAVNSYMNQISNLITYVSVVIHHHRIMEIAPSMRITCDKHTCFEFTTVALSRVIQLLGCVQNVSVIVETSMNEVCPLGGRGGGWNSTWESE